MTKVFQFQSIFDFNTTYVEGVGMFEVMDVPFKVLIIFRNYGHGIPICDAMREFYRDFFKDDAEMQGKGGIYEALMVKCDTIPKWRNHWEERDPLVMDYDQ